MLVTCYMISIDLDFPSLRSAHKPNTHLAAEIHTSPGLHTVFAFLALSAHASQRATAIWYRQLAKLYPERMPTVIKQFEESQRRAYEFRTKWDREHTTPFITGDQWKDIPREMTVGLCLASKGTSEGRPG